MRETYPIAGGFEVAAALGQRRLHAHTEAAVVALVAAGGGLRHGGGNCRLEREKDRWISYQSNLHTRTLAGGTTHNDRDTQSSRLFRIGRRINSD